MEVRKEPQSAQLRLEKQKKTNSLEMKIVSVSVNIETKEKMTDKIKLDQKRSNAHVNRLVKQTKDMKLLNLKILTWQAVLPQVKRHLVGLTELCSQGKRLPGAIQTRLVAAITKLAANTVPSFLEWR